MSQPIKIFGHLVPDTDTVASAIAYTWYYNNVRKQSAEAFVLGELNKETAYILKRFGFETPKTLDILNESDQIVIVDTNNIDELPTDMHKAELLEVIDHHKLSGGITTASPVSITMRPMASTASLIYTVLNPELHPLPAELAGLMLSAIISDTLEFRSPTTTNEDKEIATELARIANIDTHELATEMFKAKSDISDMNAEDLIMMDSKVYEVAGKKIRFSVVETTNVEQPLSRIEEIKKGIFDHIEKNSDTDDILLFIIDIVNEQATPIVATENGKDLIEKAFGIKMEEKENTILKGVVSRKKQIVPLFEV